MHATQIIWILSLALTLTAALLDWRSRRIPNRLTVLGFFVGLTVHTVFSSWHGMLFALEGAGLALVLLLPLVLLRGLGAGDWKLMGAIGALTGWRLTLLVLIASFVATAMIGIIQVALTKKAKKTLT